MKLSEKLEKLRELGFVPEKTVEIVDTIYKVGSPYPQGIICRWWAISNRGEKFLIEEKILKIND